MSSMRSEARTIDTPLRVEPTEMSDGVRLARYCTLDELPGLVLGVLTVAYIVQSLAGLIL